MKQAGCPKAKVQVCTDPLIGGIGEALKTEVLGPIIERYHYYVDLFLLCVDRDSEANRTTVLKEIERRCQTKLSSGKYFFAKNAWQELEVWVLADHVLPPEWSWKAVRAERDAKEKYFLPFAKQQGCLDHPAQGRGVLAQSASRNYRRVRTLCPEDIGVLERRIAEVV